MSQGKLAIVIRAELHCECEHFFPIRKVSVVVFADHDSKMEGKSYTQRMRSRIRYLPITFTVNDIGQFRSRLGKKLKTLICLSGDIKYSFDTPAEKCVKRFHSTSVKYVDNYTFFRKNIPRNVPLGK